MNYITYTHLLEHLPTSVKVINKPVSVRNAPEKLLVAFFKELMPETIISRDKDAILNFQGVHKDIVCLLYTSPSPRDVEESRMPSSA